MQFVPIRSQRGATLIEVLVAIALTGILFPALATALITAHAGRSTTIQQLRATSLLKEGTEAVRSVREKGWTNVATDGTYHPVVSGSAWALSSGTETLGGFTRQIVISTPERNAAGALVASGGTNDPSTKHVVVTVSWTTPYNGSITSDSYLTRWQNDSLWTQTSQSDFSGGTLTNTCVTTTCDTNTNFQANAVQLQDTPATWQLPSIYGSYNITGSVAGNDLVVATIGGTPYAFVGYATGLAIINISNPANPTLAGTYTTSAAVNGVFVSGNYAYLATSITTAQLTIVNVANPAAPTLASSFRIQDTNNVAATAVYVSGTTAVVVKKKVGKAVLFNTYGEINTVNVSNPANPSLSDSLNVGSDCNNVWVNGSYAYVADSVANQQLTIVNISSPTSISSAATVNLGANANSVVINGSTAYIATVNNTSTGELRLYNLVSATSLTSVGSYEVGGSVTGLGLDTTNPNYLAVGTAVANKQLILLNISNPATPVLVNNVVLGGNGNSVRISGSYAFVGTSDTTKELTVVYSGYRPSGSFESSTFDAGVNGAGYNRLLYAATVPGNSTLRLQIAANNTNTAWSYIGPDGTSATYFTADNTIPLQGASGRYFRYKAFFTPTSNGQQTPVLSDVTVNYSP